ncbi:hypothetical protein LB505_000391 [Fusarium chuoi]|nr:hypothetical protein LB505_000391 [Fusarium chuoi]
MIDFWVSRTKISFNLSTSTVPTQERMVTVGLNPMLPIIMAARSDVVALTASVRRSIGLPNQAFIGIMIPDP